MFALLAGTIWPNATVHAQRSQPIAVSVHHRADVAPSRLSLSQSLVLAKGSEWQQRGFWTWTGIGVVVGGIAGAIWAGVEIAHSNDPMLPGLGIALGTGAGAIGGGLVGALSYTISHSPSHSSSSQR